MASSTVSRWAPDAIAASQAVGGKVPPSVLLGLTQEESGGREGLTSSAGAGGLTQFMPGTAQSYGVDVSPGHARSQLVGAAHYLVALGFANDPEGALRKYNAGPNASASTLNSSAVVAYARNVLSFAKGYAGVDGGAAATGATPAPATSSSGLVTGQQHSTLVRFGLTAGLVVAAVALIFAGVARTAGVRSPLAAATGAKP